MVLTHPGRLSAILFAALSLFSLPVQADLVVLQYHHISDTTPAATSTSVSLFTTQLQMIRTLGLEVVPLESGTRAALKGTDAETSRVAITFDDAYLSVFTNAVPILASHGFPYTVFVNTRAVGRAGYMNWDQLRELARDESVTIANHSADHGHLARRRGEPQSQWQARVQLSLDEARETLERKLGANAPLFAYPYGEFDSALESLIGRRGWFGYGQHSGPIGPGSAPTRLPRFPMAEAYGQPEALKDKLLSRAFPMGLQALPDGIVTANPPILSLELPATLNPDRLSCFASGQGRIPVQVTESGRVEIQAPAAFHSRRFRYNCTSPAGGGRYYWLSQPWLDLSRPED